MSELDIQLDREAGRFEALVEGHSCVLDFTIDGEVVSMNHVGVPEAVGGRGIAGQLTRHALDWAKDQDLKVRARCPYVAAWIERHPEYQRSLK
ncbi:GNAT family N-acetyltransferase [Wenzhouxiangella sp. EGI_FJ10409]|uniref:GNAT family N-acetyltransferase n=1 Tax=Wenzhouxiangella sp. EGI_FJ10409 TaxID=3243767 RepID=UPI0035D998C3